MSSQLASLTSQFEEFKRKDKPSTSQRDASFSQEQGMCAPASQTRSDASEGEFLMRIPTCLPENDTDLGLLRVRQIHISRNWITHMWRCKMLSGVSLTLKFHKRSALWPLVPSLKKPTKQVVRKQNLALPPVQDIKTIWDYRFRKTSGSTLKDKISLVSRSVSCLWEARYDLLHNFSSRHFFEA